MSDAAAGAVRPRLLFVVNDIEHFIMFRLPIARAAMAEGYAVHLATPAGGEVERIADEGISFHPVALPRGRTNPWSELGSVIALYRLFRRLKPSIVHLVTLKPVLYGGIAARAARTRGVVAAVSGLGSIFIAEGFRASLLRGCISALYRVALGHRRVIAVFQNPDDRAVIRRVTGLPAERAVLVKGGSGVSLADYPVVPEPEGVPVVALAARLLRDKGVVEYAEAARRLRERGVVARFWLIGDIDPANPSSLSAADVAEIATEGLVEVLGFRADVPALLGQSNLVVLPSYREGLPKVLIEAAACGRAVVTTDVPGCRDAIVAGETGLLMPVKDSPALADAIEALLADPARRREMGRKGRAMAEEVFDIRGVVAAHLRLYAELLR